MIKGQFPDDLPTGKYVSPERTPPVDHAAELLTSILRLSFEKAAEIPPSSAIAAAAVQHHDDLMQILDALKSCASEDSATAHEGEAITVTLSREQWALGTDAIHTAETRCRQWARESDDDVNHPDAADYHRAKAAHYQEVFSAIRDQLLNAEAIWP